ncbi:septum site-determining protein MinD [Niallia sp. JL1B1071]|uniref:septum site-determining protein MinD n=1 Tax=Niallia tiangongensis TaxID=3237105 RepID=UPI0037DCF1D2
MGRIITITSGKGGVGKTTVTANLGTSLALQGKAVCLIDADIGLRNLDIPLGLSNRIVYDIVDYIEGICELRHVIIKDKRVPNLAFIPGSQEYLVSDLSSQVFKEAVNKIAEDFEYVLIDSPAGIEHGFRNALDASHEAIVVVTPDRTSIQDADRVIGIIEQLHSVKPVLIINMLKRDMYSNVDNIENRNILSTLQLEVLGTTFEDIEVVLSLHNGVPIALDPSKESGLRFRHMARNLINNQFREYVSMKNVRLKKNYWFF